MEGIKHSSGSKPEATTTKTTTNGSPDLGATDPREWSVEKATLWVHSFLGKTAIPDEYENNGIDGAALVEGMTYRILHQDLGFKVGPALNVMRHVEQLRRRWGIVPMTVEGGISPQIKEEPVVVNTEPLGDASLVTPSPPPPPEAHPLTPPVSVDSASPGHSEGGVQNSDSEGGSIGSESWNDAVSQLSRYLDTKEMCTVPQARHLSLVSAYFVGSGSDRDSYSASNKSSDSESGMANRMDGSGNVSPNAIKSEEHGQEDAVGSAIDGSSVQDMDIGSDDSVKDERSDLEMKEDEELAAKQSKTPEDEPEATGGKRNKKDEGVDTDNDAGPPKKIRRRIAPSLLTETIPEIAAGNIVEQGVPGERLWVAAVQSLAPDEARKQLELAFPTVEFGREYGAYARQWRAVAGAVKEAQLPSEALSLSDTMWFRRTLQGRTAAVVNRMQLVQAWHRLFIRCNDTALFPEDAKTDEEEDKVLPLLGESSDGEISDGLHREIEREQKEQKKQKHRAESAERQRVELVKAVVQEMIDGYTAEWHAKQKPSMERRAHSFWAKYRTNHEMLNRSLEDLEGRRLPRERKAVLDSGVRTRRQVIALCTGLQSTVDSICCTQWLKALMEGQQPLRNKPSRLAGDEPRKRREVRKKRTVQDDDDTGSSSDGMNGFIDDDELQPENISDSLSQMEISEDKVLAAGVVGNPATNGPIVEDGSLFKAEVIVIDSSDDDPMGESESDSPLLKHVVEIPHAAELAAAAQDTIGAGDDSIAEAGQAVVGGDPVVAEMEVESAKDKQAVVPESMIVADVDDRKLEVKPVTEVRAETKGSVELPSPESARRRLRYGRRSMAVKAIDDHQMGETLAEAEQSKTVKKKRQPKLNLDLNPNLKQTQQKDRRQAQTQPQMTQEKLAEEVAKYTAAEMYDAAKAYVRLMAATAGRVEVATLREAAGVRVGVRVALRVWAEFQGWRAMGNGRSNDDNGSREQRGVGEQFEDVANSLVLVAAPEQRKQRRELAQTPHDCGGGGQTQFGAFKDFCEWRRAVASESVGTPVLANPGHGPAQHDAWMPGFLAARLHEHQVAGVRFAWRAAIGGDGGCILAHAMGLGKTLQAITLIYTLLSEVQRGADPALARRFASRRVLVLCPVTVQDNWAAEFRRWTGIADTQAMAAARPPELPEHFSRDDARRVQMQARGVLVQIVHFGRMRTPQMREAALRGWDLHGGVLLMGYSAFREAMAGDLRALLAGDGSSGSDRRHGGPCLVVADEAHILKNRQSQVAALAAALPTKARVCMTGSPLQNRLEEYWTMADFCRPGLLGEISDFRSAFVVPINAGLYADSTPGARKYSRQRLRVLQALLAPIVDRRDATVLHSSLPRKVEYVIACPLTPAQDTLYRQYLDANVAAESARLFEHGVRLGLLCNHPAISMTAATPEWCANVAAACVACVDGSGGDLVEAELAARMQRAELSAKATLALAIVRLSVRRGERILVFSRSISTLDFLQRAIDAELPRDGRRCLRIDGGTPVPSRQQLIDQFNDDANRARVFLISAATASVGVNLPAASRVIIFDVGWNPLYDDQAVARAYRYGQRRRVYVYRLMTRGTWEEHLFRSNVFKVALTRRVIDDQPMGRWAARAELKRYFRAPPTGIPRLPSGEAETLAEEYKDDLVFSALIRSHQRLISMVMPHATLLANEDEAALMGEDGTDGAALEMLVRCEKERLGLLLPPPSGTAGSEYGPVAGDDDDDPENIDAEIIDVEHYTAVFAEKDSEPSSGTGAGAQQQEDAAATGLSIRSLQQIPPTAAATSSALPSSQQISPSADTTRPTALPSLQHALVSSQTHVNSLVPIRPTRPDLQQSSTNSLVPIRLSPSLPQPARPVSQQTPTNPRPAPPQTRPRVRSVEAMILSIILRLKQLPTQAPVRNRQNLMVFINLFSMWLIKIQEYIGVDALDAELRGNKVMDDVADLIPDSRRMMDAVMPVYRLTDAELRKVVENHRLG